uniref:Cytochrome P450 n=1 Tax=Anoplophora glabripennis TaxID=217634 RepID=A0A8F8N248_ANOGL|nr:cytochrome P450 [Anoplophora glabripennis]
MIDCIQRILVNAFCLVVAILVVALACFRWRYQYWKRKNVPYLEPSIPFGSIGNILLENRDVNIAKIYEKVKSKDWKYCGLYMLLSPVFLVVDIDLVKRILASDFQYFNSRGTYTNEADDPVGCNLFSLSGKKWKNLRTKLTPAFSSGKLKSMFQTVVDCGLALEEHLQENYLGSDPLDAKNVMQCFSTDVIGSCAFGIDCNSFKDPNTKFKEVTNKFFFSSKLDAVLWLFVDNFPGLSRLLKIRMVKKEIGDFFIDLVDSTVAYREANNYMRKDFMQQLIDIRNGKYGSIDQFNGHSDEVQSLTMDEIAAQTFIFFVAGSETSGTTLTFALFEMAMHPEIQDRLREEILTVLSKHDGKITYDSLNEMKYMSQVIDETLRLYSPAQALERRCLEDYKIPGEDIILEKGTRVMLSVKGIHYDEDYWPNPKQFDPDRFSDENRKNMNPFTFLAFGQGPRICVGDRFGRMQVKVGLTSVLRKFRVKLNKRTKVPLTMSEKSLIASADGEIWLNLEKL